jgi:hypothetical protein
MPDDHGFPPVPEKPETDALARSLGFMRDGEPEPPGPEPEPEPEPEPDHAADHDRLLARIASGEHHRPKPQVDGGFDGGYRGPTTRERAARADAEYLREQVQEARQQAEMADMDEAAERARRALAEHLRPDDGR